MRAGFWRLYEFSKDHPEYFALMFLDRSVPRISRDWQRFGFVREMKTRMAEHIQSVIDAGLFPPGTDADRVFRILLASIHGVAVMRLCERLAPTENADALAHDTLEAALAGLRAGAAHAPAAAPGQRIS
jgi:AcrR family transcriptional regulator